MNIERDATRSFIAVVGVSCLAAAATRRSERALRAAGRSGNTVMHSDVGVIEYKFARASVQTTTVIVLENGLGAPLECWDWTTPRLSATAHVLSYNRAGYGTSTFSASPSQAIQAVLKEELGSEHHVRIVLVGHSIGSMAVRESLAQSQWLRDRTVGVCFVDSTDPELLAAIAADPQRWGKLNQAMLFERLGAWLGTSGWSNRLAVEVDYRAVIQQRFLRFSVDTRTVATARNELQRYAGCARECSGLRLPPSLVISAERSHEGTRSHRSNQCALADRLSAPQVTIDGSAHRSILGFRNFGEAVAEHIIEWLGQQPNSQTTRSVEEVHA